VLTRPNYEHKLIFSSSKHSPVSIFHVLDIEFYCDTYAAHPHNRLALPAIQSLSLNPILFSQVPTLDTVLNKLTSFISTSSLLEQSRNEMNETLSQTVLPYLKSRFAPVNKSSPLPSASANLLTTWASVTSAIADALPLAELFPLVDMWRLTFLDPSAGTWCSAVPSTTSDPIIVFLKKGNEGLDTVPRNYVLTLLRLLCNAFSSAVVAKRLLSAVPSSGETMSPRDFLTSLLVSALLHQDAAVRTAAASLAFNVAGYRQKGRVEKVKGVQSTWSEGEDGDWEVEMVSAIVEAIEREKESEEVGECFKWVMKKVVC
jgi:hypothetical protein